MAREVRSVRLNFGEGGYAVNAADAVLRNRYGDWKDKSALLAAMLKAVGVEAFPVLAGSDAIPLAEDVPSLKQFDCVLVAVPRGGGYFFLDSFADDSQYGYFLNGKGAKGLIVKPGAVEIRRSNASPERKAYPWPRSRRTCFRTAASGAKSPWSYPGCSTGWPGGS